MHMCTVHKPLSLYQDQSFIQRLDTIVGYIFLLVRECGLQDMRGAYSVCPQIPVFHITYLHVGCIDTHACDTYANTTDL